MDGWVVNRCMRKSSYYSPLHLCYIIDIVTKLYQKRQLKYIWSLHVVVTLFCSCLILSTCCASSSLFSWWCRRKPSRRWLHSPGDKVAESYPSCARSATYWNLAAGVSVARNFHFFATWEIEWHKRGLWLGKSRRWGELPSLVFLPSHFCGTSLPQGKPSFPVSLSNLARAPLNCMYRVAQKSKPLPNDPKIFLNRIIACQWD